MKYLFLKFTKKVHITHLLFGSVIDVWVLYFFITLRVGSSIGNRQWSRRDENGIGEMRGDLILGIGWEEMWLWRRSSCSSWVKVQNFILGIKNSSGSELLPSEDGVKWVMWESRWIFNNSRSWCGITIYILI